MNKDQRLNTKDQRSNAHRPSVLAFSATVILEVLGVRGVEHARLRWSNDLRSAVKDQISTSYQWKTPQKQAKNAAKEEGPGEI